MPRSMTKTVTDDTPKRSHSDYILCHSVIAGGLNIVCRSGNFYRFKDYGSECDIEYRDLVDLVRSGSDHVFLPRFVVDDADFVEEFPQLKKTYDQIYSISDLNTIIKLPNDRMRKEIEALPDNVKSTLKTLIATEVGEGKIDSVSKIRVLSEVFDSDFNLLSELFAK